MPNIQSAKKRVTQSETARKRNLSRKTAIKTAIKKVISALDQKNIEQAKELLRDVESQFARAKSKNVFHKNTASRKVSRLAQRVAAAARPA